MGKKRIPSIIDILQALFNSEQGNYEHSAQTSGFFFLTQQLMKEYDGCLLGNSGPQHPGHLEDPTVYNSPCHQSFAKRTEHGQWILSSAVQFFMSCCLSTSSVLTNRPALIAPERI
jgi:hypothetical protein